jgi:hypothetical protein
MLEKRERPFTDLITCVIPFADTPQVFTAWDADPLKYTKIMVEIKSDRDADER